jgi:hypothetical protein
MLLDHQAQRRMFAMLEEIGPGDVDALAAVWAQLHTSLTVHAAAEERFFYPDLLRVGRGADDKPDAVSETDHALKDHNEIRETAAEVEKHAVGSPAWFDALSKANHANSSHMAEEERQGMTDFRRNASLERRHALAVRFATFTATHRAAPLAPPAPSNRYTVGSVKGTKQPQR